jgi:oligogalacturonide lyase
MSFYFHNNPFVPAANGEDDKMVFYGRTDRGMQLFCMNLKTLDSVQLTDKPFGVRGEIVAPKLREAFFQIDNEVFAVNVDNRSERHIATLPEDLRGGVSTINADATLLAGTYSKGRREIFQQTGGRKASYFDRIFEAKLPSRLFVVDVASGKATQILEEVAWINHLQFSPTDPNLLMFCHEGPWHKVDRIWLIDVTTRKSRPIHERTVEREIAGHEFWAPDGKTIWFDLQIPRGETFYLAGYEIAAGTETRYSLARNEWSVHYNITGDQKLFCGDGGGPDSVAKSEDGQWLYLFKPDGDKLNATRVASLKNHDYDLEPNTHFSPDSRRIIFRSNMHGTPQIYAAERN